MFGLRSQTGSYVQAMVLHTSLENQITPFCSTGCIIADSEYRSLTISAICQNVGMTVELVIKARQFIDLATPLSDSTVLESSFHVR